MNLLASYDWLKEYVALKEKPEDFAARLALSGPGVERLHPQGEDLKNVVTGHVVEIKPHPNADKLKLAVTDIGDSRATIVCGGSNLKADQWVAVALLGARVRWHGEGELVELRAAEIRGVKSEGMICAANEIGLYDAFPHAEREILDLGAALPDAKFCPGVPLTDVLGLSGDTVMDIEVTTNRPDAMGMVGLAREASAILGWPFTWKQAPRITPSVPLIRGKSSPPLIRGGREGLSVQVSDKKICPRYMAVRVDGVTVGPSPWWIKRRLLSAGVRPVNNVVDITNFVMLELGQPMHAFDANRLSPPAGGGARGGGSEGTQIQVRKARAGESFDALDGKTYELDDTMLVIADAEKPIAVAGVMGGEHSGTHAGTMSVIFEAATFDPVSVRRTARKLNLYSDSQLRFEKGLSTEAPPDALARAVELCLELVGGSISSKVADVRAGSYKPKKFSIKTSEVNALIGVKIPISQMKRTLSHLGFKPQATSYQIRTTVPPWRDHDIESGRDLIEEIARVYGYGNIPAVVPPGISDRPMDAELAWEDRIKTIAKGSGLTETSTYSFVSKTLMEKAGYGVDRLLRVQNPLSADFEYMRTTLLPSLLQVVEDNQERDRALRIFEVAHVYYPTKEGWKDLPDEQLELGAAFLGDERAWKRAKGFVEHLLAEIGVDGVTWKALSSDPFWHPGRAAQAFKGEHLLGTIGEAHPSIAERFKIEGRVALVDLPLEEVFENATTAKRYVPIPAYPEAKRDLALIIRREAQTSDIKRLMKQTAPNLAEAAWFDTYRGKGVPADKKSVAFHLTFRHPERTLETKEVEDQLAEIEKKLKAEFRAEVRR